MRTALIVTHRVCNQNCAHCTARAPSDDRAFVRGDAVRARLDAALASGAREMVFTGGEPTLRTDLTALIAHARAGGAETMVLETNATLIDAPRAAALRDAGLTLARVNLTAWGDALDAITRDPGGFAATLAGLRALLTAGVAVELAAVVVRATRASLPALPAAVLGALGGAHAGLRGLRVTVPIESPEPGELVGYDAAVEAVLALDAAGRRVGLAVRLDPDAPPPCVFPPLARAAHLFALTAGGGTRAGFVRQPACDGCAVRDRCPGISRAYLARHGRPTMRPVTDERTRRRLSVVSSVEAQVARELVTRDRYRGIDGGEVEEHIVRVNFNCNQACRFCFVSTHLPGAGDAAVRDAIETAGRRGAKIVLSGGEPTLNPHLGEYVRLARASSPHPVNLQTNATRLGEGGLLAELVDAGLGEAFVSLHGSTAEVSDAVTEAPGTFVRTVAGLDALARTAVHVTTNFVICRRNVDDLPAYVRMVAARWPRAWINVSFVAASTDVVPRERDLVPRYTDAIPHLRRAMDEARRLAVTVVGFESMCGIPLCLVPDGAAAFRGQRDASVDGGEFVRAPACEPCTLRAGCFGMRRSYAEIYGTGELRTVPSAG